MLIFCVNVLHFLPRYVINDFWIDIIVNRIAVTDFAVIFGVCKDFVYFFVGDIVSFFRPYAASLKIFCQSNRRVTLRILRKDFLYDFRFFGVYDVLFIYDVISVYNRTARILSFAITLVQTAIEKDNFGTTKFTVQVANPPYSAKWSAASSFLDDPRFSGAGKLAPSSKADFAFVEHMVYHMDDDGRVAVLLPHGVLFRGGSEDTIRRYLIKDLNVLDAVIGLSANLFHGTSIPVCCLVLRKYRNGNAGNICFIDASKYFTPGKNMNQLSAEDIDRIVNAYIERKDIDKFCHVADMQEIESNDYNLNIPRYVDTFEEEPEIDIKAVMAEIKDLESQRASLDEEINKYLKELGILED